MGKTYCYRMIINPLEFQNLVDYLNVPPTKRNILINLNRGPKRFKALLHLMPQTKEGTLRKNLLSLTNEGIIGSSHPKQLKKNAFYFSRRRWFFYQYQKYLDAQGLGSESKRKYFRALDEIYKRIDGETRDREKIINQSKIERQQVANTLTKNPAIDRKGEKRERELKREAKNIGDSVDRQFIEVGKRTELGELLLSEVGKIIENLKNGNPVSDVLGKTWSDVYGNDADPTSHVVEEAIVAEYDAMLRGTPSEERRARIYLCISGFFELLDMYEIADKYFEAALTEAKDNNLDIYSLLTYYQISKGHILIHTSNLMGAAQDFIKTIENTAMNPVLRARSFFRLGEVEVYQGKTEGAIKHFKEAIAICGNLEKNGGIALPLTQNIKADALRKCGTAYRIDSNLDECFNCYAKAQEIYNQGKFRGIVWLLHGWAEYHKAKGYNAMKKDRLGKIENNTESQLHFEKGREFCRIAKKESARIRSINRYAHALLIECEINRIEYRNEFAGRTEREEKITKSIHRIAEEMIRYYGQCLEIYFNIGSRWGIANVFISQYLAFKGTPYEIPDSIELLDDAEDLCKEMGLERELGLIQIIKEGSVLDCELNPSSLY